MDQIPAVYETDAGLKALANYLRSANGVKVRSAIEHDKRVEYFKGINGMMIFHYHETLLSHKLRETACGMSFGS